MSTKFTKAKSTKNYKRKNKSTKERIRKPNQRVPFFCPKPPSYFVHDHRKLGGGSFFQAQQQPNPCILADRYTSATKNFSAYTAWKELYQVEMVKDSIRRCLANTIAIRKNAEAKQAEFRKDCASMFKGSEFVNCFRAPYYQNLVSVVQQCLTREATLNRSLAIAKVHSDRVFAASQRKPF